MCVEINIRTGEISFALPDFGLGYKDTTIPREVWDTCSEALLKAEENWGIIELGYQYPYDAKTPGKIKLMDFTDFCPYETDLEEFKTARESFSLDEWIDILLSAVDYNPAGYESRVQKLSVIQRLLPFAEKNLNLIELAPPGTGKSYLFGQISRYGWLVSGKVTRAKLIYDIGKKADGIKRICTAYLKLLFPHVRRPQDITSHDFNRYCLQPAMDMRAIIRIQMGIADEKESGKTVPSFSVIDA